MLKDKARGSFPRHKLRGDSLTALKVAVLVACLALCLLQSRAEILLYLQHRIYTATSIDQVDTALYCTVLYCTVLCFTVLQVDQAPVHLVFCDSDPIDNKDSFLDNYLSVF